MSRLKKEEDKLRVIEMDASGYTQTEIASEVLGRASAKSTIGDFLRRETYTAFWSQYDSSEREEKGQDTHALDHNTTNLHKLKDQKPFGKDTGGEDNSRVLLISDLHAPYNHPKAVEFLRKLKDKYQPTRVISLGDECFPGEIEVLTPNGFKRLDYVVEKRLDVAQYHENGSVTFTTPERWLKKPFQGDLLEYRHRTMVSRTTPNHNLVKINPTTGTIHRREAWDSKGNEAWYIPRFGRHSGGGIGLTEDEIRLMVAFQADGTSTKGAARFGFSKARKAERLEILLNSCRIPYTQHKIERGDYQFYVKVADVPWYFVKRYGLDEESLTSPLNMSLFQKITFVEELEHWDGTVQDGGCRYTSAVKENVEYVQMVACLTGVFAGRIRPTNEQESCYYVDIRWNRESCSLKSAEKKNIPHNGEVYCVTVPTGMIVVRQDGHISISGNCDKHALSYHDSDPDLMSAGDELTAAKEVIAEIHDMFPNMDIIESNHGSLVWRKTKTHGIPRAYIRSYNDVLGVGDGWKWHHDLTITLPSGQRVYLCHGKTNDVIKLSQQMGMCAVQGHYHEIFKVNYWANPTGLYWGLQIGCLVDDDNYAFAYNNTNIKRPIIGTGLIIDGKPILEPMEL